MAAVTVYSAPDDGREERPKHVELLTPNKEHKKVASRWHLYEQILSYVIRSYLQLISNSVRSSKNRRHLSRQIH